MAVLQVERICSSDSVKEINDALASMPNGIPELYSQSLEEIAKQPDTRCKRGMRILSWISYARRPLSVDELLHALAAEESDPQGPSRHLDRSALVQPKALIDVCAGLVTVEHKSKILHLIHSIAHEFLRQIDNPFISKADENILKASLSYLSLDEFRSGPSLSDEDLHLRLKQHPFFSYASQCWGAYLMDVQNITLQKMALTLLEDDAVTMSISQISHFSRVKFPEYSQLFPKQVTSLHLVAAFGLLETVRKIFSESRLDPTVVDSFGWTALHRAAENGHEGTVEVLLEHGCDANAMAKYGGTPLHRATKKGHINIATRLLHLDQILVDAEDKYGGSALHRAARSGHAAIVLLLLERGASVNLKYNLTAVTKLLRENAILPASFTTRGYSYIDIWRCKDDALERLQTEIEAKERIQGGTALHNAASSGHESVVQCLLQQNADVNAFDNFGATALHRAAHNGHIGTLNLLMENGAFIDSSFHYGPLAGEKIEFLVGRETFGWDWTADEFLFGNMSGGSPLLPAARRGHEHAVRLLLAKGANVNVSSYHTGSALHQASRSGHAHTVQLLVEQGADVDIVEEYFKESRGGTALHEAAVKGFVTIARILLDAGANVNKPRGFERQQYSFSTHQITQRDTPLTLAVEAGHKSMASLLLNYGAEPNWEPSDWPLSLLSKAARNADPDMVQLLLDHGATGVTETIRNAMTEGRTEVLRILLQGGIDVNMKVNTYPSQSILFAAIDSLNIGTVELLLSVGARLDVCFKRSTPLQHVMKRAAIEINSAVSSSLDKKTHDVSIAISKARTGCEMIVQTFLKHGVDVNVRDRENNTPLHFAAGLGFDRVAAYLLASGADVNSINSEHETPLYFAASEGHVTTIALLLNAGARVEESVNPLYEVATDEAAKLLLDHGAEIKERDEGRKTLLIDMAGEGVCSVAQILLRLGYDIEATDKDGKTALHNAIDKGKEMMVQILLEHGADVNRKTAQFPKSPFDLATDSSKDTEPIAIQIFENGADLNSRDDSFGRAALSQACSAGIQSLVRAILEREIEIDAVDKYGDTALSIAAPKGDCAIALLLLEKGASVDGVRKRGRETPLSKAARGGHVHHGANLDEKGVYPEFGFMAEAAGHGHLAVLQTLLEFRVNRMGKASLGELTTSEASECIFHLNR